MLLINHAVSNRADLRERTKAMRNHGDRRGVFADFRDCFEIIKWLYLHFKCGLKTKTHFEWLLWHWSSLGQLNLEPVVKCQRTSWRSVSKKPRTCFLLYNMLGACPGHPKMWVIKDSGNALVPDWCQTFNLKQCWLIVKWNRRNTLQWNSNENRNVSLPRDAFKYVAAKFLPFC